MEEEGPYCVDCTSCGEGGCCSPFMCLKRCVSKNPLCKYGEESLWQVELGYKFSEWVLDEIDKKGSLSAKDINTKYGDMIREWQERNR